VLVYAVDAGTTNVKVVLYDETLRTLSIASAPAALERDGDRVEFDAALLFATVVELIGRCAAGHDVAAHEAVIVLTGQAESLVLVGDHGEPVRPAMSWLDDRAVQEVRELEERFAADVAFAVTGEPFPSSTWPAAKLRWLAAHEPESLARTRGVLMIKDELIRRFTGRAVGEVTTRGFTYLWDVARGNYWDEMLDFCAVPVGSLPEVVAAGTELGPVIDEVASRLPTCAGYRVNVGALDHFCAMAGTGSYLPGVVSESAGTVLSLSLLATDWVFDAGRRVSFHAGLLPGDIVQFNGVDSGGVALDWYQREGLAGMPYEELETRLARRGTRSAPLFLPYLTGVNPPDYFPGARGAFLELDLAHDRVDMAYAVEEGIAHLLRRNVEYLATPVAAEIVSTGGGTASRFFNQLKADVCGIDVVVPAEQEATCRGAAVLALVAAGRLSSLEDVERLQVPTTVRYVPGRSAEQAERYRRFEDALHRLYEL
jgi:sugar (pentulose or hexulose) kinase